jgi:hypothetical protein
MVIRDRALNPAVAVIKRVDRHEPQMRERSAQGRIGLVLSVFGPR